MAPMLGIMSSGGYPRTIPVDFLVVAGGGGGGYLAGSGGGAGGLRCTVTATGGGGSLETAIAAVPSTNYTVTIGAGGAGGASGADGSNGSNSVFSTITSTGGAGGRAYPNGNGLTGGSGGHIPQQMIALPRFVI